MRSNQIAHVKNVTMLATAADSLCTRSIGMPGIGLVWGPSGYGKSTATTWLYNRMNGIFIRAWPTWTPVSMLAALMHELSLKPLGRTAPMIDAVVRKLSEDNRPVFIDEADYLADKPILLETLRSLHDVSSAPLILIGMRDFKQRVMGRDQLRGRISEFVEFQPADMEDARLLTDEICEKDVADDLLGELHKAAAGEIRRMTVGLGRIESFAKKKNLRKVNSSEWGGRPFFLGDAPRSLAKAAA
jgi:hypothetical protein